MRRKFGMLMGAFVTIVGLSLIAPEQSALARRGGCGGKHHRKQKSQCCGTMYYNQCGPAVNYGGYGGGCGYAGGCGTAGYGGGAGYGGAAGGAYGAGGGMRGPTPAQGGGTDAPAPPAPGT
jgi:hypothetical protein